MIPPEPHRTETRPRGRQRRVAKPSGFCQKPEAFATVAHRLRPPGTPLPMNLPCSPVILGGVPGGRRRAGTESSRVCETAEWAEVGRQRPRRSEPVPHLIEPPKSFACAAHEPAAFAEASDSRTAPGAAHSRVPHPLARAAVSTGPPFDFAHGLSLPNGKGSQKKRYFFAKSPHPPSR